LDQQGSRGIFRNARIGEVSGLARGTDSEALSILGISHGVTPRLLQNPVCWAAVSERIDDTGRLPEEMEAPQRQKSSFVITFSSSGLSATFIHSYRDLNFQSAENIPSVNY
jgi:hypothetical protein